MDSSQALSISLDPRGPLEELARCASKYCLNLNGRISKDDSGVLLRGGNATVYLGRLCQDNARGILGGRRGVRRFNTETIQVAIKTPRGGPPDDLDNIKRIIKEVHIWSKLRHENVLRLLGITTEFEFTVSIVSPWMSRGNVRDYVRDRAVDPCPLIMGIAKGLHYLHSYDPSPIFHGDLKGANVLISDTGNALLADFGFSHSVNSSCDIIEVPNNRGMKGTINWMAPEMFDCAEVSAEADVWAFGMTALELFTCKDPFYNICPKANLVEVRIIQGRLPDRPSDEDTHSRMTDSWWGICYSCWNQSPSSRPTTAKLVNSIAEIMNVSPESSIPNGALQMNGSVRPVLVHLVTIWHNVVGYLRRLWTILKLEASQE